MILCEEYLTRHAIKVPLIRHANQGVVFYKDGIWFAKQFHWHPPEYHPGMYVVTTERSLHNGLDRGRIFDVVEEITVQWDEYEQYLLQWASNFNCAPCSEQDIKAAQWEMLLRGCDRALIRHMNSSKLSISIDLDLPLDIRCGHIDACIEYFSRFDFKIYQLWESLSFYQQHYATWLAEIVCAK